MIQSHLPFGRDVFYLYHKRILGLFPVLKHSQLLPHALEATSVLLYISCKCCNVFEKYAKGLLPYDIIHRHDTNILKNGIANRNQFTSAHFAHNTCVNFRQHTCVNFILKASSPASRAPAWPLIDKRLQRCPSLVPAHKRPRKVCLFGYEASMPRVRSAI